MLKKYTFPLLSSCFLLIYSMSIYAKPQEKTLEKYALTAKQHAEFCQQWVQFCTDGKADTLFQVKNNPQQFYAIHALKLGQLQKEGQIFKLITQWDFSTYQSLSHAYWAMSDHHNAHEALSIFPKLFPLNEQDDAIGIVQTWSEGYSGGGLSEEVVDFVKLKPDGKYQQVFQNIPLSMYRMIRACFSEQQYIESQGKCHDEYSLDSQILYVKPNTWQVKYHFRADFSPASDTGTKPINLRKTYLLKDNREDAIVFPETWN